MQVPFLTLILQPPFIVLLLLFFAVVLVFIYHDQQYRQGAYYRITGNSYSSVKSDKGKYGEYLAYEAIRHFENNGGKFLFNILIPKVNGGTTEVDMLLICQKGIFVFECKNYSGWIFGNENQRNWVQTLPIGRGRSHKEWFYNPIMQNASHIKHLKNLVGKNVIMHSVVVFADRCNLVNITKTSDNIIVTYNESLAYNVERICKDIKTDIFTEVEINSIYNSLFPYTQYEYAEKTTHIQGIEKIKELDNFPTQ